MRTLDYLVRVLMYLAGLMVYQILVIWPAGEILRSQETVAISFAVAIVGMVLGGLTLIAYLVTSVVLENFQDGESGIFEE